MNDSPAARILANAKFCLARVEAVSHGRQLTRDELRQVEAYQALIEKRKEAHRGPA
jgi:hypothetical protein